MIPEIAHRVIRTTGSGAPPEAHQPICIPPKKTRMCILPHFQPSTVPDVPRRMKAPAHQRPARGRLYAQTTVIPKEAPRCTTPVPGSLGAD
jgi:hypothetical protein